MLRYTQPKQAVCLLKTTNAGFLLILLMLLQYNSTAQKRTIPGEVVSPFPTITNLAVDWYMQGDNNQNGTVTIHYREKGEKIWKVGMPLRRVPAGKNLSVHTLPVEDPRFTRFDWANKHSGSIFDLKPGTHYEIRLRLTDPDGGSSEKYIEASTRPIPVAGENAEIIEIPPGTYDTLHTKSGNEHRPMVYRCSKGKASFGFIDCQNKKWVFLEGLHITNLKEEGVAIRMDGSEHCVVSYCTINAVYGIVADLPGATNCYFSDNTITGTCSWTPEALGAEGKNIGEGIQVTGPGNVICYNKITGFRDCISTMEDQRAGKQVCIDIYNNDIYQGVDDGIEADFCFSNCRILRNRITDSYVGLSSQPGLGGPTYFIRNVMYNILHSAFKLKRFSKGDVVLHNTVVKIGAGLGGNSEMDYAYFRNNLAFGGPTQGIMWGGYGAGRPYAADIIAPGTHSSFDFDAVGVSDTSYVAMIGEKPFAQVEKNGIGRLTLTETFSGIHLPEPMTLSPEAPDLRPKKNSKVIDAAMIIPNINDRFKGKAPDCGAYEEGDDLPHYGPRIRGSLK